jgi:RNA polymerase sigma-54 factor
MALELRQQLKLTQQLIMTPQLQMAIKLLQLSRLELMETIRQELEENPTLEDVSDDSTEATSSENAELEKPLSESAATKEVTIEEKINEDIDWANYIDEYNTPGRINIETEGKEAPKYESFIAHKQSLQEHLNWQVLMSFTDDLQRQIGSHIIGNLNADGYLEVPIEEIAKISNASEDEASKVLEIMQTFDPIGVCARDLKECLVIQIYHFGLENDLLIEMIQNHMNHLENRNFKAICRILKADMEDVTAAVNIIKSLEPRPGREFSDDTPQYITPDIYVHEFEGDFVIALNDDGMPKLKVNALYRNAITKGEKVSNRAKEYIQEKMRSAAWLIRSIHQRQKTIYKVMESILKHQQPFFEKGIAYLKPMVLRDVAQDIDMHESTISRVTTNKYAYTPQGIFELKYFFNSSISKVQGGAVASVSVQQKIREIIENEDSKKPYSDDKISIMLKQYNIDIARRTVAKYREMMRILPSNKRKQF